MLLLVYSLFSHALATPIVLTGAECSEFYVMGVSGYKDVMAHKDPDDPSDMGKWGQKADDSLWTANPTTPYPDAQPKACKSYYGPCSWDDTDPLQTTHSYMSVETCATLRFSFPSASESTVYKLTNNDTFQACDFTGAEQITTGGDLTTGDKFIEFAFDNDVLDQQFYFASQSGCTEGQKIAVTVVETMGKSYQEGFKEGQQTVRVQHCDCDHAINPDAAGSEAFHLGFVEGCKSQMPDDLSCCPGADVECSSSRGGCKNIKYSNPYKNGGSCIHKSDQQYYIKAAKEVHTKCSDTSNKAECDEWMKGYTCPWYRVYNMGGWVFNTDIDGTGDCPNAGECTGDKTSSYPFVPSVCSTSYGCEECAKITPRYHGRCDGGCAKNMDKPENYACDGANSTYTPHCDMWFMVNHCAQFDPATGKVGGANNDTYLAGYDADAKMMIDRDVNEDSCGRSRYIHAYQTYTGDTKKWDDWLASLEEEITTAEPVKDESFTVPAAVGVMLAVLAWK
jgi:hypothetical protein